VRVRLSKVVRRVGAVHGVGRLVGALPVLLVLVLLVRVGGKGLVVLRRLLGVRERGGAGHSFRRRQLVGYGACWWRRRRREGQGLENLLVFLVQLLVVAVVDCCSGCRSLLLLPAVASFA